MHSAVTCEVFTLKGLPLYMDVSLQETLIPDGRPGGVTVSLPILNLTF